MSELSSLRYFMGSLAAGIDPGHLRFLHVLLKGGWTAPWGNLIIGALMIAGVFFLYVDFRLKRAKTVHLLALEQKEAAHLKATDELKTRFFANITHEFRTPLSLIISPLEQVLTEGALPFETRQKLSVVERNAEHLLRLVNELLDVSKLETGHMKVSLFQGDLHVFVAEMAQLFTQNAANRQISLKVDTDGAEGYFLFDTDKWEKILFNLISNALKFTPAGGQVNIRLRASAREEEHSLMHLSVSDNGIGIPSEKLPFIFQRFYQVKTTRPNNYEGTGIGLSLVKELAELMEGTVSATSTPGKGTEFQVTIPVNRAAARTGPQDMHPQSAPSKDIDLATGKQIPILSQDLGTKPLVLIVEDNEELGDFISKSLAKNYRTLNALHGAQGLMMALESSPDVIISDVMMPEMDGYALCRQIKSSVQTDHIAVILLTAKASHPNVMQGLLAGADGYVSKPFHVDELLLRLHNLLLWREKLRQLSQGQLSTPEPPVKEPEGQHRFITDLYCVLDEHLNDHSLGVEKLASLMAVGHRTLNRKLTALIGLPASEVVKQYRLKKSIALLKSGHNVSETAYLVGFETHSNFTTSFKTFFGMTPTSFLKHTDGSLPAETL